MNSDSMAPTTFPSRQAIEVCRKARRVASVLVLAGALGQLLIDASMINLASVALVVVASLITFQIIIRGAVVRAAPLPALVVLGFNIATLSGALIAQSFSLRPLAFNLQVPLLTFFGCALFQLSLLVTLLLFVKAKGFRGIAARINRHALKPLGVMRAPTPGQLWLMGLFGASILAWTSTVMHLGGVEYGDVGMKLLFGLTYLAYAPFLIPVLRYVFPESLGARPSRLWPLLVYFLVLIAISVARNSRGTFAMGFANLGMAAFLLTLMGQVRFSRKLKRGLVITAVSGVALMPALSDLATAMVVVRGERDSISNMELMARTADAFQDKAELDHYRRLANILVDGEYNETYMSNPFLARFVQTKFFDNTLALEQVRNGARAGPLWDITFDKILANLPSPVLRLFSIDVDKRNLEFSMGDALYAQQTGTGLGGYRTGSPLGHGIALMGSFIYLAVIPLFLAVFIALQALTSISAGLIVISPVILLQFMRVYFLAVGDSLLDAVSLLVRGMAQDVVLYAIVFAACRWSTGFFRNANAVRGRQRSMPRAAGVIHLHTIGGDRLR